MKCRVSGRVQGVWFRAGTREQAQRLGLTGYARNLPDGSVEVLACGADNALSELKRWLQQGTAAARVDDLQCELSGQAAPADFSTG